MKFTFTKDAALIIQNSSSYGVHGFTVELIIYSMPMNVYTVIISHESWS